MKKLLSILFLIPFFFLASCVSEDGDDPTDTDTENNNSSSDNGSNDTGDNTGDDNQPTTGCGNKIVEESEICDGNAKECTSIDPAYTGGYATCKSDCSGWDMTGCKTNSSNGDADSGSETGPADSGDSENSDIPLNCTGISFDSDSFGKLSYAGGFQAKIDADLGNTLPDDIRFEFFLDDGNRNKEINPGEYDLGTGRNTNYSTCNECLTIYQDITNYSSLDAYTVYFQKTGTMKIDSVDEENFIEGTVSAKLIEVTIDNKNKYTSTPVPNGSCVEIETGTFKKNPPKECKKITIDQLSETYDSDPFEDFYEYTASYSPNSNSKDEFRLQIKDGFVSDGSTYNLKGTNYSDSDKEGAFLFVFESTGKSFFQESGSITFTEFDSNNGKSFKATLDSIKLVEVELTETPKHSTPIPGGDCFEITNTTLEYSKN